MPETDINLATLQQEGILSPVDVHLAKLLARLAGDEHPEALLGIALTSQWTQRGHVCLNLQNLAPEHLDARIEDPDAPTTHTLPAASEWAKHLRQHPAIAELNRTDESVGKPMVLWRDHLLYLRRYWDYETSVARRLREWLERGPRIEDGEDRTGIDAFVANLFDQSSYDENDDQQRAVVEADRYPFFILTGGPGTGKTTTVLRLLALLLHREPDLTVALAAPTGKAALRLQDSISQGVASLACKDALKGRIPQQAETLHRLLGYRRHSTRFRHDANHPLPHDVVVVDEASMMDLSLCAKLLDALKPSARLILVGDRDQLPSVEAGAAFEAFCDPDSPLPKVELKRNYRFSGDTGIGGLARAIRSGDADQVENLLGDSEDGSCRWQPLPSANQLRESLDVRLKAFLDGLAAADHPEEAFTVLDSFRVLCAHRTGPYGSVAINELVQSQWARTASSNSSSLNRWYPGRPLIITENDYATELFNGDTGVVLPWKGKLHAFFRASGGEFRHLPPARLPAHESAYAMSVHKSQGSEFDEVHLILTDRPTRILTRELLYTGVTRARSRLLLWSSPESLRASVTRRLQRTSGMKERFLLWDQDANHA